jgi:hypothetical protein
MCKNQRAYFCLGLVFLSLCSPLATSWAEGMNSGVPSSPLLLPGPNTTNTGQPPTDPWTSFDSAWNSLKSELTQWSEDSQMLYGLLEALQTEADGLRSSLMLSTEQLQVSEAARLEERQATEFILAEAAQRAAEADSRAAEAEKQASRASMAGKRWRNLAFGLAGVGALGWITAWAGLR